MRSAILLLMCITIPLAYGHGLGSESVWVDVGERSLQLGAELPTKFDDTTKRLTLWVQDAEGNPTEASLHLVFSHSGSTILEGTFEVNGTLPIDITTGNGEPHLSGDATNMRLTGKIFEDGGLYTIHVRSVNGVATDGLLDLLVADYAAYMAADVDGDPVQFSTRSYFDKISSFSYDAQEGLATLIMPFDWQESRMSHIPVLHMEVHFPIDYDGFVSRGYIGQVNGVNLFRSSVTVDDFTYPEERTIHLVLLQNHLDIIKSQMGRLGDDLPDDMIFTLQKTTDIRSQLSAFTVDEQFQVDMTWEPEEILPDQKTKFIFTIRDAATGETLRNSHYDFVLEQGGSEIYRTSGVAEVGGDFAEYEFGEEQAGTAVVRIENIRGSGQHVAFVFAVAPEFGTVAILVMVASVTVVIILSRSGLKHGLSQTHVT